MDISFPLLHYFPQQFSLSKPLYIYFLGEKKKKLPILGWRFYFLLFSLICSCLEQSLTQSRNSINNRWINESPQTLFPLHYLKVGFLRSLLITTMTIFMTIIFDCSASFGTGFDLSFLKVSPSHSRYSSKLSSTHHSQLLWKVLIFLASLFNVYPLFQDSILNSHNFLLCLAELICTHSFNNALFTCVDIFCKIFISMALSWSMNYFSILGHGSQGSPT